MNPLQGELPDVCKSYLNLHKEMNEKLGNRKKEKMPKSHFSWFMSDDN